MRRDIKLSATKNNIVFIGFMGSGKTTIGRTVSKKLGRLFLDVDTLIESRENREIMDIFREDGESYFRNLERETAQLLKSSVDNSIIAVGGGFPTAVENIQELGYIVYLDIDFDFMIEELKKSKEEFSKRPLLQEVEIARKIYESRKEIYQNSCNIKYEVKNTDFVKIADEVIGILKREGVI